MRSEKNVIRLDFKKSGKDRVRGAPSEKRVKNYPRNSGVVLKMSNAKQTVLEKSWRNIYSDEFVDDLRQAFLWMQAQMRKGNISPEHCDFNKRLREFFPHPKASEMMFFDFDTGQLWYVMVVRTENCDNTPFFYVVDDTEEILMEHGPMLTKLLVGGLCAYRSGMGKKWQELLGHEVWVEVPNLSHGNATWKEPISL